MSQIYSNKANPQPCESSFELNDEQSNSEAEEDVMNSLSEEELLENSTLNIFNHGK
jgi:hypothetical protein